mmetsp:Transcript_13997/g.33936  ORF Transcript_13997/g.33936 Transcript_13997/m.33936 type:complete len:211 (-) Transcript_13997:173-805(-)
MAATPVRSGGMLHGSRRIWRWGEHLQRCVDGHWCAEIEYSTHAHVQQACQLSQRHRIQSPLVHGRVETHRELSAGMPTRHLPNGPDRDARRELGGSMPSLRLSALQRRPCRVQPPGVVVWDLVKRHDALGHQVGRDLNSEVAPEPLRIDRLGLNERDRRPSHVPDLDNAGCADARKGFQQPLDSCSVHFRSPGRLAPLRRNQDDRPRRLQ